MIQLSALRTKVLGISALDYTVSNVEAKKHGASKCSEVRKSLQVAKAILRKNKAWSITLPDF